MAIDARKLRIFATIAQEGSINLAARKLNVAQPWISVQIRQLEDFVGFPLFNRSRSRKTSLTAEGQALLPYALGVSESMTAFMDAASALKDNDRNHFVLGTGRTTLHIPERNKLIRDFMEKYPDSSFKLVTEMPHELYKMFESGDVDILFNSLPPPDCPVDIINICRYETILLLPVESDKIKDRAVTLAEFSGMKVMSLPASYEPSLAARRDRILKSFGIEIVEIPEEGDIDANLRYAQLFRMPMITLNFPEEYYEIPKDMIIQRIDPPWYVDWALMCHQGRRKPGVEKLWRLATEQAASRTGAPCAVGSSSRSDR